MFFLSLATLIGTLAFVFYYKSTKKEGKDDELVNKKNDDAVSNHVSEHSDNNN